MPIYEYRCAACGHTLDALQKLSDAPLTRCPECEADSLKRLISAPAFRLKGGGWYETDFKSDKEKKRNLVESSSESSKTDGKTDGKASESKSSEAKKPDAAPARSGKDDSTGKKPGGKGPGSEAA
jgi:putative FmdB family regulatory protein